MQTSKASITPMNPMSTDPVHMMAPVDGRGEELYFRTDLSDKAVGVIYNERLELGVLDGMQEIREFLRNL